MSNIPSLEISKITINYKNDRLLLVLSSLKAHTHTRIKECNNCLLIRISSSSFCCCCCFCYCSVYNQSKLKIDSNKLQIGINSKINNNKEKEATSWFGKLRSRIKSSRIKINVFDSLIFILAFWSPQYKWFSYLFFFVYSQRVFISNYIPRIKKIKLKSKIQNPLLSLLFCFFFVLLFNIFC